MESTSASTTGLYGFGIVSESNELAEILLAHRDELAKQAKDFDGIELMSCYSDLTDALIRRILDLALDEVETNIRGLRKKAARGLVIAAVGGYGRREMSPFSDVDVAFIVGNDEDDDIDLVVKRAFRILMDVLECTTLKVGYSYRRINDVENLPIETETALVDARCIIGSNSLFSRFKTALNDAITPAKFVYDHINSRNRQSSQSSTFVVEPDIKEGCGGLRDIHAARWITQVAFGFTSENVWSGLRSRGLLLDQEVESIRASSEFISRTRNALHLITDRGTDVLSSSRHAEVAEWLGYSDPETFIATYYRHAQCINKIYGKVAQAALEEGLEIEPGIIAKDSKLKVLDRGLLLRDSAALIRIFLYKQVYGLSADRDTNDLIAEAAASFKLSSDARRSFVDIISRPGCSAALRSMAGAGVLQAVIPQFAELMFLVPGDAVHKYTVGEHSLRVVEQMECLFSEDNDQFADVFSRIQNLEVLFFAALLHDIGKLDSLKDHTRTGALRASKIAAHLGMSTEACEKIVFLVRHHLRMAETARLRDLNQRKTIQSFISIVKDLQLLDMLLLLTVADFRAVGTHNWSQVQVRFLLELHDRAMAALRSPGSDGPDIDRHRSRVSRELCLAHLPPDEVDKHCQLMPASYLLNTPPDELAAHIGYARSASDGIPVVDMKDDRAGEFTQLTVVAKDRVALLSDITGVMHTLSIDIHAAQIFTRDVDLIAIDILYIDFEGRQLTEMKKWQLEGELMDVLSGGSSVDELLSRRGRKKLKRPENAAVALLENVTDHGTAIEIRADDAPGLLHYFTHKISEQGWDIHSARITTWGHEARDVFYVTDKDGVKLDYNAIALLDAALKI